MNKSFPKIIQLIKQSRAKAIKAVNSELIELYWNIGAHISQKVEASEWRQSVVSELADFIQRTEPAIKGFSDKNLWRMKQFYEAYSDFPKLSTPLKEINIDLLFYHRNLQCLVAFELKTEKFKPEHLGQLNFYLEALDRDVKRKNENPSIGILLCKDKDTEVIEYALSRSLSPTMISEYKTQLPDKKLLQQKLQKIFENQ